MDGFQPVGTRQQHQPRDGRPSGRHVRNLGFPDRSHDHRRSDRHARRLQRHHRPHYHSQQAQADVAAGHHHVFHVGGAGQHDHDDHHGNAAAANHCGSEGALDFRQPDRHRGQQRRRMVAHRRRDDDHALDARQRHCGGPDGNAFRAVHRIGNHPDGDRDALRGQRRRGPRGRKRVRSGAAQGRGSAAEQVHPRHGRPQPAVRTRIQEHHPPAALHGHDGFAARAC